MIIDNRVSGKTKLIGIIGNPLEHSISPQLHNTISTHLGVDVVYVPFKVEKNDLEAAVKGLKAVNIVGFNVTIPYKKDIMKFIDDNTKEAILMGAVNTVKNIEGRLYGYNTDAEGFARSFREELGTGFKGKRVAVLGAGGAARAIAVKVAVENAAKLCIINRTLSRAQEIAEMVNNNVTSVAEYLSSEEKAAADWISGSDIIINTTSIGMHPITNESPIKDCDCLSKNQVVYDIVYNPSKTKLMHEAEQKGCKAVNGLRMLFYQAIYAYEIWTGIKLQEPMMKELFDKFKNYLVKVD